MSESHTTTFMDLLERSIIVQSILTLLVISVWLYLYATNQQVPGELTNLVILILGFYFGSKSRGSISERYIRKQVQTTLTDDPLYPTPAKSKK